VTAYLSFEDIVRQVRRAGFVVLDAGLLASAIARPQASAFGVEAYPDLFDKAAAMCHSIDNNQALVDGNKRLAWTATKVFLRMNGWQLFASADDGERFMVDLVAGGAELADIAGGLRSHSAPTEPVEFGY
jgi:death-on-curing protein